MNCPIHCPAVIPIQILRWIPKFLLLEFVPSYKHLIIYIEPETEHFINCIKDKWADNNVHYTNDLYTILSRYACREVCIAAFRIETITTCINKWLRERQESPEIVCRMVEF